MLLEFVDEVVHKLWKNEKFYVGLLVDIAELVWTPTELRVVGRDTIYLGLTGQR